MVDAVCLGILVADVFSSPVDTIPEAGELRLADRFLLNAGGCAVNTAACLRRLGKSARVLGKVGRDLFGDFVLNDLERLQIDSSAVSRSDTHPTSGTFILNVRGQDRRYIHVVGANGDLRGSDIAADALEGARVLYVGGYLAMPSFSVSDLAALFREARSRSIKTVLDVIIPAGRQVTGEAIEEAMQYTDVFLPNQDEARYLTGATSPEEQAARLSRLNPECIVAITGGKSGVLVRKGNQVWRAGAYSMPGVDESGAGDAFASGIVTGIVEGWPIEYMLQFASALGASCTTKLGCTEGVFRYDEAVEFVKNNPLPIETTTEEGTRSAWQS